MASDFVVSREELIETFVNLEEEKVIKIVESLIREGKDHFRCLRHAGEL